MINDVISSIDQLVSYLVYDNGVYLNATNNPVNIFEYAVTQGGYEIYLQFIYGAIKKALYNRNVLLELALTDGIGEKADIAYPTFDTYYNDNGAYYHVDFEEMKCFSMVNADCFVNNYCKDIVKVNSVNIFHNKILFHKGYAVGFIAGVIGNDYLESVKQETIEKANDTLNKLPNIQNTNNRIYCTEWYTIGNIKMCAVITNAFNCFEHKDLPPIQY